MIDYEIDKSYRDTIAKEIDPLSLIEPAVYKARNESKSWKNTRYPKIDPNFICISKDGTLGKVFKVGDLIIGLPSSEGKEIMNEGLSGANAKWKRTPIPKDFLDLEIAYRRDMKRYRQGNKRKEAREAYRKGKRVLEKKHEKHIEREFHRREHGLFIKVDEEVVYITGSNYMFLNYYFLTEDNMYPHFRITAMHTWWHWAACQADPTCWGELRLKSRRVAWTSEAASEALNMFTQYRYSQIPVVSENERLAKKLFTEKVVKPFKYYPTFFKPVLDDPNKIDQSVLEIEFDTDNAETSNVGLYPTKAVSYDSTKAHPFSINDEVGKYVNVSFTTFRGNHKDCHFKGLHKIVSTGKFGSTAGAFSEGGKSFKYEFESARASKRDKLGKTVTQLISLFVDDCYTSAGFFDEWGYPVVFDPEEPILNEDGEYIEYGAVTSWENDFNKLQQEGDKTDLNNFLRQHPRVVEHAFRSEGGANNDFDIDNLNNHADFLRAKHSIELVETIFRGNLVWTAEPYNSPVEWRPSTNGRFFTTWIPPKEIQNNHQMRRWRGESMLQTPGNSMVGSFGVDSYDIDETVDGRGSNGAIVGASRMNLVGCPNHSLFLKYAHRPDKAVHFYDDTAKALWFFGVMGLIENNKPRILEHLVQRGMRAYIITRPDKKWKDLSKPERQYGGIPSSKQGNADQAILLKSYIFDFMGQNLEEDCKVWFIDLVEEFIEFNVKKRKRFDLSVATQLALLANQYMPKQRQTVAYRSNQGSSIDLSYFGA